MKQIIIYTALFVVSVIGWQCKTEFLNPNKPSEQEVTSTREGLITLSIGMKAFYADTALEALIVTPGTTSRETKGITTFTNIIEIENGGSALPTFNGNILSLWSRMYRVMGMAERIIENAPTVLENDNPMRSGLIAHAHLFKAMALGGLATGFEQVSLNTDRGGQASFVTRQAALEQAILLLEQADALLTATPPSAEFYSRVVGSDFRLRSTINAYRARYNLMAGRYAPAIAAANLVSPDSMSRFVYDGARLANPVHRQLRVSNNYAPRSNFGLPAGLYDPADARLDFYLSLPNTTIGGETLKTIKGFAQANAAPFPVYLPDEMRLIRAEAIIRSGGALTDALAEINAVRTQTTGDVFGVYANLPPYGGAVTADELLLEVYRQRSAELYLSGVHLEDNRRFGRPAPPANVNPVPLTFERTRNFYPYPDQERLTNPQTPPDPAL
jgi:hypothetical protein